MIFRCRRLKLLERLAFAVLPLDAPIRRSPRITPAAVEGEPKT